MFSILANQAGMSMPEDNFNATGPFVIYIRKLEYISMVKGYWDELRAWYVSFTVMGLQKTKLDCAFACHTHIDLD